MLKQHEFYVYHQGATVLARRHREDPVVAEALESPQAAYDKVQSILNPAGLSAESIDPRLGFLAPAFQAQISERSREYVEAAYARAASEVATPAPKANRRTAR